MVEEQQEAARRAQERLAEEAQKRECTGVFPPSFSFFLQLFLTILLLISTPFFPLRKHFKFNECSA